MSSLYSVVVGVLLVTLAASVDATEVVAKKRIVPVITSSSSLRGGTQKVDRRMHSSTDPDVKSGKKEGKKEGKKGGKKSDRPAPVDGDEEAAEEAAQEGEETPLEEAEEVQEEVPAPLPATSAPVTQAPTTSPSTNPQEEVPAPLPAASDPVTPVPTTLPPTMPPTLPPTTPQEEEEVLAPLPVTSTPVTPAPTTLPPTMPPTLPPTMTPTLPPTRPPTLPPTMTSTLPPTMPPTMPMTAGGAEAPNVCSIPQDEFTFNFDGPCYNEVWGYTLASEFTSCLTGLAPWFGDECRFYKAAIAENSAICNDDIPSVVCTENYCDRVLPVSVGGGRFGTNYNLSCKLTIYNCCTPMEDLPSRV